MNIHFNIVYSTAFGEELTINLRAADGGEGKTLHMTTVDGHTWSTSVRIDDTQCPHHIDYSYAVCTDGHTTVSEWQTMVHRISLDVPGAQQYTTHDRWQPFPHDSYLYSSAFTDCINRHPNTAAKPASWGKTVRLVVRAPQLRSGERLFVVGEGPALGEWRPSKAIAMTEHNHNEWTADLDGEALQLMSAEYKFIAIDDKGNVEWETCDNRLLTVPRLKQGDVLREEVDQSFFAICDAKLAGTLIPVFSLRSEGSFGVGDFGDLKKMIDWVADTHQRVLQLLPINDTTSTRTWTDSYPYSCISIFALHPQYVDLRQLPQLANRTEAERFDALRAELNALDKIDYERVNNAKTEYMRLLFAQEGEKALRSAAFKKFFKENQHWLVPYAQYCHLRDIYGTAVFAEWPDHKQWCEADRKALSDARSKAYGEVAFYYYMQYVLDAQMTSAHEYAVARGVVLKGDIPIGVNRNGCDVWHEPQYFCLDSQAGAPPDAFAVNGQNWGFPTYNWPQMIADGCQWWVRRFQNMAKYFDAYRIDHVLGFFRIWAIPTTCVNALTGQFDPSLAMTREEIESYGLHFQEELFTTPFIAQWIVDRVFGRHAAHVVEKYLKPLHDDIFCMRPEYDTERKIEAAFEGKTTADDVWIRDGLYSLVNNVLFVRDRNDAQKYHPRITAQLNFMYEALVEPDKQAFNRLYNDYYYRRNNQFWYSEAMKKLPLLVQATRMLVCAEDLGMVPDCVAWVMQQLRILSLELQQMPKDPALRFGQLSRNPYRSVCTLSTHDMATLRQWWDEDPERTQDYYANELYRSGAAPHPLPGWLARDIVAKQLTSPSMLCILSLQDWLAIDEQLRLPDANGERINIPANPRHYWRYRMHVTIEQLQADTQYNTALKQLIDECGRRR